MHCTSGVGIPLTTPRRTWKPQGVLCDMHGKVDTKLLLNFSNGECLGDNKFVKKCIKRIYDMNKILPYLGSSHRAKCLDKTTMDSTFKSNAGTFGTKVNFLDFINNRKTGTVYCCPGLRQHGNLKRKLSL